MPEKPKLSLYEPLKSAVITIDIHGPEITVNEALESGREVGVRLAHAVVLNGLLKLFNRDLTVLKDQPQNFEQLLLRLRERKQGFCVTYATLLFYIPELILECIIRGASFFSSE